MSLHTGDSCVNKLIVGDFNQLSRAIQGDTQRFKKKFTVMCFLALISTSLWKFAPSNLAKF